MIDETAQMIGDLPQNRRIQLEKEEPRLARRPRGFSLLKTMRETQREFPGSLVDDLLEASRIVHGHLELAHDQMSVGHVVHKTAQKLSNLAEDKGIEFEIDVPSPLATIEGDEERLTQGMTNLLHNAIKCSHEKARITVRAEALDSGGLVRVADQSIGISSEDIPRLFQRFYQADGSTTRQNPGTGLGLYITR